MTTEPLHLMPAFLAGLALGFFYFGSLWLTVRRVPNARHPVLLVFGSLAGRMAVLQPAFYFIMADRWERMMACLLGFVLVRLVITRRVDVSRTASATQSRGTAA